MKEQRTIRKEKGGNVARQAVSFEVNPYYEQLLEMREKKPAAYRVMSPATRLAVEAYVKAKTAASEGNETRRAAA